MSTQRMSSDAATTTKASSGFLKKVTSYREFGLILAFIVLLIIAAFITPDMYQPIGLHQMLRNYAVYGILAVGMMAVIITGGIDLSIGSSLALAGIISSQLMLSGMPVVVCLIGGIAVGALCGLINGFLVGKLHILPLIATLATMYIFRGIAYIDSGGAWLMPNVFKPDFTVVAMGTPLGIYNILVIYIAVLIVFGIFFSKMKLGRRIYAVGSNQESAQVAGINIGNIKMAAYLIMGVLAGLSGFLYVANYSVWEPQTGTGIEMEVIAICILGGVNILGGSGKIGGVIIATLMMSVLSYFLSMLPGMSVWKMALQGAIIIIAVAINIVTNKLSVSSALKARVI